MDINSPIEILTNLFVFGVMGGIVLFASPVTLQDVPGIVAANPFISAGLGLFLTFLLLFGSRGSHHHHHH